MDVTGLRDPVARLFAGHSTVEITAVREEPIEYDPFMHGRSVSRLAGTASVDGVPERWSMIRKRTAGPAVASAYLHDNGRRELLAYRSGMLSTLPSGFSAPAAYGLVEHDDGSIDILLEEVDDDRPGAWRETDFLTAARHLGRFSGAGRGVAAGKTDSWLFTGWRERHGQPGRVHDTIVWMRDLEHHPVLARRMGARFVPRAVSLLDDQVRIRSLLERLPQTLCHHDAQRSNLYLRSQLTGSETVAIDWESLGPGAVGADLASLLFSSVRRGDLGVASLRMLQADALDAYGEGLREEGWSSSFDLVRLGFGASVALRWSLLRDVVVALTTPGASVFRGRAMQEGAERSLDELIGLAGTLVELADESGDIARRMGRW